MNLLYEEKDKYIYIKANLKKNYSVNKISYLRTYNKTNSNILEAYPIKPLQNVIPKDINLQKIFVNQKTSLKNINKEFVSFYDINTKNIRKKNLIKIKEFILRHRIDYKIYYRTIILYDTLLIENKSKKLLSNEEITLGALILSVKFNYIENKMISMKKYLELYENKIYTLKHLIEIERICLYMSKYYLNYNTPMCFLEYFLMNGIIFSTDSLKKEEYNKIYQKLENVLENIMEKSNNYLRYNFFHLTCSIVSYVREIFNLEKWPYPFKKIFGIEYITFEGEYKTLFNKYSDLNNSENKKEIIIRGNNNTILLNFQDKYNNKETKPYSSRLHLYQKSSNNINNNKYCNNIINININNYSIDNNINSYSYKKKTKPKKNISIVNQLLLRRNNFFGYKFNTNNTNQSQEQKNTVSEKKYDIKIINSNKFRNLNKSFKFDDKNKTTYFSPDKKDKINNYLQGKNIYNELEEENSKENSNELNDEFNQTYKIKRNYNFSSRFNLKNNKSTSNINYLIKEKNQINNQSSKIIELKRTINEHEQIKVRLRKYDETPKKISLYKSNNIGKYQTRNYATKDKIPTLYENNTEKKNNYIKPIITSNAFETPSKPKEINKINFNSNFKEKKVNKIKNSKYKYNNLIKYKLSISSSSYKTKGSQ